MSKTSQNKFNNFSWDFREFLDRNLYSRLLAIPGFIIKILL
ncbi:MAG: hypothetical protein OHM56_08100 [Spiroplasma phoeniceum]|nr:MAG: hypothetical protein OHM57_07505 [Spiroplasma phoeniceum]UZQ31588.1 MAG: hypothetical protein OHM56_08100 [Spiroplasma phoeniceum]